MTKAEPGSGAGIRPASPFDWAEAVLSAGRAPLLERDGAACWTGFAGETPMCLLVETGPDADPGVADRAIDFAARTGAALATVLVDGGARSGPGSAARLRAAHRLSGVLPHAAVETGARSATGRLRAAAADWSAAVSTERERGVPHFSADRAAATWLRDVLSHLPANRTVPASAAPRPAGRVRAGSLDGRDPSTLIARIADGEPVPLGPAAAGLQTGLARLDGATIGYAASTRFTGDGETSAPDLAAAARLIEFCDAFHLPVVAVLDTPGLAPGTAPEALNPLVRALAETATPTAVLVTRRAGGPAAELLTDRALVSGEVLAWPGAHRPADDRSAAAPVEPAPVDADRVIAPERTREELLSSLLRWATVDEPRPERRRTVPAR